MSNLASGDQELLRLIEGAQRTAGSMNRNLILDEKKLVLVGATQQLIAMLRDRKLLLPKPTSVENILGH